MFEPIHGGDKSEKGVTLYGKWGMNLYGPDGELKQHVEGTNVVCTNGKEWLASLLYSCALAAATNTMKYIAIGTDSTGETSGDTALGTEVARHTGTVSYLSNQIYQVTATFAAGTGAIVEYGLFSSNTGGTMFSRDTESAINKGASDVLTVYTQVTVN